MDKAKEAGDTEVVDKMAKRLVRATKEHSDECKQLLGLMGIPYVEVGEQVQTTPKSHRLTPFLHVVVPSCLGIKQFDCVFLNSFSQKEGVHVVNLFVGSMRS